MKRINELKQERTQLIEDMQKIVDKTSEEKRGQTEDESKLWNEKNGRVNEIDAEVKQLERQEELNLTIVKNHKDDEQTVAKRYDFGKAVREARTGGLTGLEKEMHQEAQNELRNVSGVVGDLFIPSMLIKRDTVTNKTVGGSAGDIPTAVGGYDVVVPSPLYKEMGATVYENLTAGKMDLPFSKGHTAGKVDEGSNANQGNAERTKGTLTASRFQGYDVFSQEYLSESAIFPQMLADMVASIDRAVGKELISSAADANIFTGSTGTTVGYEELLAIMGALDNETFVNEGWTISKELFYHLASTVQTVGDAKKVIELIGKNKGRFAGIDVYGTGFLPEDNGDFAAVYGDWNRSYVGFWGGVQLLIDPYSEGKKGEIIVHYSRMGDTAVNPYAFSSRKDITLV